MQCTHKLQGRIQDFLRGGSEHKGVSLMQPPRSYKVFCYYNTEIVLIVRHRAYLSKYKEVFNQIWSRGVVGATPWKMWVVYYIKC